jgi:hypothetical protein
LDPNIEENRINCPVWGRLIFLSKRDDLQYELLNRSNCMGSSRQKSANKQASKQVLSSSSFVNAGTKQY